MSPKSKYSPSIERKPRMSHFRETRRVKNTGYSQYPHETSRDSQDGNNNAGRTDQPDIVMRVSGKNNLYCDERN